MTRIRYTMPAGSQGEPHMRRGAAEPVGEYVRMRVSVYGVDSDVEALARKRLVQRPDDFHCDLQAMRIPRFTGPAHAVPDDARDSNPRDAAEAIVEATGPSPRPSVCGRPFRSNDADGVDGAEGV